MRIRRKRLIVRQSVAALGTSGGWGIGYWDRSPNPITGRKYIDPDMEFRCFGTCSTEAEAVELLEDIVRKNPRLYVG